MVKNIPAIRQCTYRHPRDAMRSFYKFVCKHELYGPLKIEHFNGRVYHYREREKCNYGGIGFSRCYPAWNASRSEARNQWEREADVHFEAMREKIRKEERAALDLARNRWHAEDRIASVERLKHSDFFKLLAAAPMLKEKA